ncbi:MAG: hypothetical protein AAF722_02155 [Cyanobacteria bacterium P01_C01_bin.70]
MTSSTSFAALDRLVAALEQRIQAVIAEMSPETLPTIRCRFQQGRLLVLSEDKAAATTAAARDERFNALALAMSTGLAETELPEELLDDNGELPVRLYLRQQGTASPYAARSWGWQPADTIVELFDSAESEGAAAEESSSASEVPAGALVLLSSPTTDSDDAAASTEPDGAATFAYPISVWQTVKGFAEPEQLRSKWANIVADWQALPWRSVLGLAAAGLAVGAIAYGISRPCNFGNCERRQTASDLSQATLNELTGDPRPDEVRSAHKNLQKAIRLVSAIPPWSSHYDAAQAELLRYRTQLSDLEWIIAAQETATEASEKSQNPPHPVPRWVEVHLLWQKAVNHLQRVPADGPLAEFAQQKLAEYEANYDTIGERLAVEEAAEANLTEALAASELAAAQTASATTLSDWLIAQREWNRALQAISKIPQGTLAYEEGRSHLSDYRSQAIQTRTRVSFEQAGERAYQDALADAAQAQAAERTNQWTQAVNFWNEAYAQMRQVPKNTLRYAEAQEQLDGYQNSLKQAQSRLKQAVALQSIDEDLAELCPPDVGICTYSHSSQQIELTVREPYDSAIRQSISPPSNQGSLNRNNSVIEETHKLVQNVMRLGNQVQLPILIYGENRQFIARYKPEYGGFAKN